MAVRTASLVGFDSRTSSQRTNDSSTFWERTSASAFKACHNKSATRLGGKILKTFMSSFLGCFLSNLLQVTIADLFEPVSSESGVFHQ